MATMATTTTTAATVAHRQPLRGISIIIEAEPKAATLNNNNNNSNSNIESDEMSLKSQSMLLAFGDNSSSNNSSNISNLQTLQVDHATKVDLETSCNTTTATTLTTTTAIGTKLYPQLLLRIGAETETATELERETIKATEAEVEAATATATIISCNVDAANAAAADVRNVLLPAATAAVGEIAAAESNSNNDNASQLSSQLVDCRTATSNEQHTVKIQIANGQSAPTTTATVAGVDATTTTAQRKLGKQISVVKLNDSQGNSDMLLQLKQQQLQAKQQHQLQLEQQQLQLQQPQQSAALTLLQLKQQQQQPQQLQVQQQQQLQLQQQQPYQLCYLVSSGQYSPCETLDSGTGSDLESIKSPDSSSNSCNSSSNSSSSNSPPQLQLHLKTTRIRVNNNSNSNSNNSNSSNIISSVTMPQRAYSLTDDSEECDESSSSLSCDSLHSNEAATSPHKLQLQLINNLLPSSLLHDIRNNREEGEEGQLRGGQQLQPTVATKIDGRPFKFEADQYYNFHVHEHDNYRSFGQHSDNSNWQQQQQLQQQQQQQEEEEDEDAFVGYKDVRRVATQAASTIRSSKGTVRGVKNRVRNGVATFLQLQQPNAKNYKEKDVGKVVLYTTSMGIIRDTFGKCANVKQILRTLLIKFEERDVFMSLEYQQEMRDRMQHESIRVPQLFVEGQHIGDADTVERLNESGELRQLLRPYKSISTAYTCQTCGGYRLLPCSSCNGSKKSVHRNHFTAEFVALKCMNCDEVGLVKCPNC